MNQIKLTLTRKPQQNTVIFKIFNHKIFLTYIKELKSQNMFSEHNQIKLLRNQQKLEANKNNLDVNNQKNLLSI